MNDIQEVWVSAVLMPTGELISGGNTIGYLGSKNIPPTSKKKILSQNVKKCTEYQLIARTVGVHERDKNAV